MSTEFAELATNVTAAFTSISSLVAARTAINDALIVRAKEVIDHIHGFIVPVAPVSASVPAPVASVAVPEAAEEALGLFFLGVATTTMVTADVVSSARHLIGDFVAISDLHIDIWSRQGRSHEGGEDE